MNEESLGIVAAERCEARENFAHTRSPSEEWFTGSSSRASRGTTRIPAGSPAEPACSEHLKTYTKAAMSWIDCLPHQPPMRLLEDVVDVKHGESATGRRLTRPDDFYFQGHFPGHPVVPAIILVELLAQTGGIAAAAPPPGDPPRRCSSGSRRLGPSSFLRPPVRA